MGTVRLTMAQALVRFLCAQMTEVEGGEAPLFGGVWAIFGHGNVAGLGEALHAAQARLPTLRAHNEQAMAHAAIAYAKAHARRRMMACTTSIGPGATNMVTAAAVAHVNRLPVLLLPGDVFANRIPDPVLQQVEDFGDPTISANDCFRPVSRYWDRITRPEQLLQSLPAAIAVLTDPADLRPGDAGAAPGRAGGGVRLPRALLRAARAPAPAPRGRSRPARRGGGAAPAGGAAAPRRRRAASTTPWPSRRCAPSPSATAFPSRRPRPARASLPWDHPACVGAIGVCGSTAANALAADADLVLAVGTRLADFPTGSRALFQGPDVTLVALNVAPHDAGKHGALPLVADAAAGARGAVGRARRLAGARRPDGDGAPTHGRVDPAGRRRHRERGGRPRDRGAGDRRGEPRGRPARRGRVRRRRAAGRAEPALAHAGSARLPPRVRLLLHGLRDRRRTGREAGAAGPRGLRHGRRRQLPDDELGDRHVGRDAPEARRRAARQSRLRLHQPAPAGVRRRVLQQSPGARGAADRLRRARAEPRRPGRAGQDDRRPRGSAGARAPGRPDVVVVIETDPGRPFTGGGAWWDVPVPEVSTRPEVQAAREAYDAARRRQRSGG